MRDDRDMRRDIPRTDVVLADPRFAEAITRLGRPLVKEAVVVAQRRARTGEIGAGQVADVAAAALPAHATSLRPVLNATGVLLHTNLGRAPLSGAASDAVAAVTGCTDVEYDLDSGRRGTRGEGAVRALLAACPAAESAHVVNNNAAALVLAATALARDREILISRGEMIEIGDGFRLPELLESAGARLREVGTTNRTRAADYAAAAGPDTAFVLKVHPSNYRIEGFTEAASIAELTAPGGVCAGLGVPLVADIGSGLLHPDPLLPEEPDATSALRAGAALVTASGDKLLGGPQAGLLLGRADLVGQLRRHPIARALRVGKLTLAALEATLRGPEPPVSRALHAGQAGIRRRAEVLAHRLASAPATAPTAAPGPATSAAVTVGVVDTYATVGGGAAPGVMLPSAAVALPEQYEPALRRSGIIGRIERGRLLLDLRAVDPGDDARLGDVVRTVLAENRSQAPARPACPPGPGSPGTLREER